MSMDYELKFSEKFQKDFSKLEFEAQSRVLIALEQIRANPFTRAIKLKDVQQGIYRVRVGDYRIRFDLVEKSVWLYCVRHRREVYR